MDRPGTCIILDKMYNIVNSSCHFGSYGSIWTGPSPRKYYMDLRSFGPYNIWLVFYYVFIHKKNMFWLKSIGVVIISLLASRAVYRGFEPKL
jgi:hypothetical protein